MKTRFLLTLLLSFSFYLLSSQVPQGFNYQAIARDGSGNPIVGATIKVRLSILTDTNGFRPGGFGTYVWEEEHTGVLTNAYGLFNIVLGTGSQVQGVANFGLINWSLPNLYLGTKIANPTTFKPLGGAKLWSVPYSFNAGNISGSLKKLSVKGETTDGDSILFEVKNKTGQTVFAVYNEGVRIYVDNGDAGTKGNTKGGFAIGGFGDAKVPSQEYFRVTRDSTRVYVNPTPPAKGNTKGGFAIGGFGTDKGFNNTYLELTPKNYFIGQGAGKYITTGLYNTFLGFQGGYWTTKGSQNIFMGYKAGFKNDTASYNIFLGNEAGYNNLSGSYNTFLGYQSGQMNTTGSGNVYIGQQAGQKVVAGTGNIFLGSMSGLNATAGSHNVILGTLAGSNNTANFNIFLGNLSGNSNTTGANNIFAGVLAGRFNRKGSSNIYLGIQAGYADSVGSYNIFQGEGAGFSNQGSNNIILGYQAGYLSTTGDYNLFIGTQTGSHNSGTSNLFLGYQSGYTNVGGSGNVFLGPLSGAYNSSGSDNAFFGNQAGYNASTGNKNIAIGTQAGFNTNGLSNIFIGYQAGFTNTSGIQNTFLGTQAGLNNLTGYNNVFLGPSAGQFNYDGGNNVFIGLQTGYKNTSGGQNTFLGYLAGYSNQTGSSSVFLGSHAGYYETGSNKLYIENTTADMNSALIYGDFGANYLKLNALVEVSGNVAIGKTTPLTKLDIEGGNYNVFGPSQGDFRIGSGGYSFNIGLANGGGGAGDVRLTAKGGTNRMILGGGGVDVLTITNAGFYPWNDNLIPLGLSTNRWSVVYSVNGTIQTSDARLKTNIQEIGYGLESILELKPITFEWKDDMQNKQHIGLIAQDVQKILGEVVDTGTDPAQTLGINYSEIVPVLIKGMQEQQSQIEKVKQENENLRSINESLLLQVKSLESRMLQIEMTFSKNAGK